MSEAEIIEITTHPAFQRAVERALLRTIKRADKVQDHVRGHLPTPKLEGTGVMPHAQAAKKHGIAEGTLINLIADGHVLGDATSVHEPDLFHYLTIRQHRK